MKHTKEILNHLVEEILHQHSFSFKNFSAARYSITNVDNTKLLFCFDRLSLTVYEHNLDREDYSYVLREIFNQYNLQRTNAEGQTRLEYGVLLSFCMLNPSFDSYVISKAERPDFILETSSDYTSKNRIGIEITELTTNLERIVTNLTNHTFGRGKSAQDIHEHALQHQRTSVDKIIIKEFDGITTVSPGLQDINRNKRIYAEGIVKKYQKYHQQFSQFDEFIILCDARMTIGVISTWDSDDVINYAKENCPDLNGCTVCILRTDSCGKLECDTYKM